MSRILALLENYRVERAILNDQKECKCSEESLDIGWNQVVYGTPYNALAAFYLNKFRECVRACMCIRETICVERSKKIGAKDLQREVVLVEMALQLLICKINAELLEIV